MPDGKEGLNPNIIFERRKFVRVDGSFVVSYRDITSEGPRSDITQTKNISLGGLLFTTDRKFSANTILRLRLRLPDAPDYINVKVQVVGSVQRVKDTLYETRVKFIGIKPKDREYIKRVIESYMKEQRGT